MDGKLLVLCDEKPGKYERYHIRDSKYLMCQYDSFESEDIICASWDSIIPEDRSFIVACKEYAKFASKPAPDFVFSKRGSVDPEGGTIKESMQEESYFAEYQENLRYLTELCEAGKEWRIEAMELSSQYGVAATQRFFRDFSKMLCMNRIVSIMPSFSDKSDKNISSYRMQVLDAWKNANDVMRQNRSTAIVTPAFIYSDFMSEYSKHASEEMLKIIGRPYGSEVTGPEL